MTDKEFKRLTRSQLIEIIYHFQLRQEELIAENEKLSMELADKRLRIAQAGNIAEAALAVNNVMQVAQNAAQQYLDEIRMKHSELEAECERIRKNAEDEAAAIIDRARKEAASIRTQPQKKLAVTTAQVQKKPASAEAPVQKKPVSMDAAAQKQEVKADAAEKKVKKEKKVTAARRSQDNDILLEEILSEFGSSSKL